jgi:hypothetical protein
MQNREPGEQVESNIAMMHYLSFDALAEQLAVSSRQAYRIVKAHHCQVVKFPGHGSRVCVPDHVLEAMKAEGGGHRWHQAAQNAAGSRMHRR